MKKSIILLTVLLLLAWMMIPAGCARQEPDPAEQTSTATDATRQAEATSATSAEQTTTEQTSPTTTGAPATTATEAATQAATEAVTETTRRAERTTTSARSGGDDKPDIKIDPGDKNQAAGIPSIPLQLSRGDYPRVDGSTATIPLSVMLARAVTGMGQAEAEAFVSHTRTTQSFYNLAYYETDLLIVYEPPESIFEDLNDASRPGSSFCTMAPIGRDALVLLVNEQNPVESLTKKQLIDIYTGKITNWSELTGGGAGANLGEIVAFQRNRTSGSQVMMENLVMQGIQMASAPTELVASEMEGLIEGIAEYNNSGNALGYSVYYYFSNMYNLQGVRSLAAEGVPCTNETIRNGTYPFTQDFYAVIRSNEPADSNARKLFELLTGRDGAMLIEAAGYVPTGIFEGYEPGAADAARTDDNTGAAAETGRKPLFPILQNPENQAGSNLFPISRGKKTGFVNGNGEWIIEPVFDLVNNISVYYGDQYTQQNRDGDSPLYYFATIIQPGSEAYPVINEYAVVIGPAGGAPGYPSGGSSGGLDFSVRKPYFDVDAAYAGSVLYEMRDTTTQIYTMNLADYTLSGYRNGEPTRQFFVFNNGTELLVEEHEYLTTEVFGADRRVYQMESGQSYITDRYGNRISGETYDNFITYADNSFIFFEGERIVSVNKNSGSPRYMPPDVVNVRWYEDMKLFSYTSSDIITVKGEKYTDFMGIMDTNYNKVTAPRWRYMYAINGGNLFVASLPIVQDEWGYSIETHLVDKTGRQITKRSYENIYNISSDYTSAASGRDDGGEAEIMYFQGLYKSPEGDTYEFRSDILDNKGRVRFSETDELGVDWLYGNYAAIRLKDDSENRPVGVVPIDKIGGLAAGSVESGSEDGSAGGGGATGGILGLLDSMSRLNNVWLLPPLYDYMWPEGGSGYAVARVISGQQHTTLPMNNTAVVDLIEGRVLFTGDFRTLNFVGYKYVNTNTYAGQAVPGTGKNPIFYAENSVRKGLLNERGEWIMSVSRFDTLDLGD